MSNPEQVPESRNGNGHKAKATWSFHEGAVRQGTPPSYKHVSVSRTCGAQNIQPLALGKVQLGSQVKKYTIQYISILTVRSSWGSFPESRLFIIFYVNVS